MEWHIEEQQNNEIVQKLYHILTITGSLANIIGFVANKVIFGMSIGTVVCGICAAVIVVLAIVCNEEGKRKIAEIIILLLINFFEFPFLYYVYGKGTMVYMILGIVGTVVFMDGWKRQSLLLAEIVIDVAVIIASYLHPSTIEVITDENSIGSTICSFVIVGISVSAMLSLLLQQYIRQQKELYELGKKLEGMAHLDSLTRLYNRRYLTDYIEKIIQNQKKSFAIVLLDIDDFKAVNDNYGHVYGDLVLQSFADILKKNMESKGIVARYGGEEFMLVFEENDKGKIDQVIQKAAAELKKFSSESKQIEITFSGGVEEVKNIDRITLMFNAADERLYKAKRTGKNKVVYQE